MKIKQLEKSGMQTVKALRPSKLSNGFPFMINSKKLPTDQCYVEYPDGSIVHVTLSRKDSDFKVISKFSANKGNQLKVCGSGCMMSYSQHAGVLYKPVTSAGVKMRL